MNNRTSSPPDVSAESTPEPENPVLTPEAEAHQRCVGRILLATAAAALSPDPAAAVGMAERILITFAGSVAPPVGELGFATAATAEGRERRAAQLFGFIGTVIGDLTGFGMSLDALETAVTGK